MVRLMCKLFGHKPKAGEMQKSPHTVFTHWQDIHCERCGKYLTYEKHYIDARMEHCD